ncbi:MAG: hypothetical protein EAZ76_13285 [Nostocales cyanobacterium]|nr:MAG: hypothetical protein EAZ87_13735 [Nostocales cyanobacterium]TAF12732.1 MAG: hypothetical protein EAZ76_13285 [Nostocales cyanobacterium]
MNLLRIRMHHLIEQISDDDLQKVWGVVQALHFDYYMLNAINEVRSSQQPWDILNHDEAIRQLMFM